MLITDIKFTPVLLKPYDAGLFTLPQKVQVDISVLGKGVLTITVEEGFKTDMGSVPRIVRSWINYIGTEEQALCYLVHDALYAGSAKLHDFSQEFCDDLLYKMMQYFDVQTPIKRWLIYTAVETFGEVAFESPDWDTCDNKLMGAKWGV
jgi:hypothetical protein